jgi:HK97 family phage prohead protease
MDTERRAWLECRVEAADNKRMVGYAIVFNSLSVDLGGFREIIAPEAVDRTINEGMDVRALVDHDTSKVIGRTRAGTLELRKDARGMRVTIEPDLEISYARDIMRAVARGDVSGMSFGFRVVGDDWNYDGKMPIRTVTDMTVSEVSVVTFPAYERTDVQAALRSLHAYKQANPLRSKAWFESKLKLAR